MCTTWSSQTNYLHCRLSTSHAPNTRRCMFPRVQVGESAAMVSIRPLAWKLYMLADKPSHLHGSIFSRIQYHIGVAISVLTILCNVCPPHERLQGRTCRDLESVQQARLGEKGRRVCLLHKIRRAPRSHQQGSVKSDQPQDGTTTSSTKFADAPNSLQSARPQRSYFARHEEFHYLNKAPVCLTIPLPISWLAPLGQDGGI